MSDREQRLASFHQALRSLGIDDKAQQQADSRLVALLAAREAAGPMAIDNESQRQIAATAFGWPLNDTIRREYGSPDGSSQGKFFCLRSDEAKAVHHDRAFWIECVLPQMYATRRPDMFDMIGGLPEKDWLIGRA